MDAQQPTREETADFLIEARRSTWVCGENRVATLVSGLKIFDYEEGDFSYNDRLVGHARFTGMEVVLHKGVPVLSVVYAGGMLPGREEHAKEVHPFLKRALLARADTARLAQYADYEEEDLHYCCDGTGGTKCEVVVRTNVHPHVELYVVQYSIMFVEPRK